MDFSARLKKIGQQGFGLIDELYSRSSGRPGRASPPPPTTQPRVHPNINHYQYQYQQPLDTYFGAGNIGTLQNYHHPSYFGQAQPKENTKTITSDQAAGSCGGISVVVHGRRKPSFRSWA